MPQGRRKLAFSSKQKKIQLQEKRDKKRGGDSTIVPSFSKEKRNVRDVQVLNQQPGTSSDFDPNRYRLVFQKESNEEIQERKRKAMITFEPVPRKALEVSHEDVFCPGSELDMPKRPKWSYDTSKDSLEAKENKYFREYVDGLVTRFGDRELSHFEMNIETWRQLWRVIEFSDIILLVVDIRFPVYHYSPVLYDYVTKELKKDIILVLNKIDLVPAPLVLAWKKHFENHFPNLHILCFASYAGAILKEGKHGRRVGNLHMAIEGSRRLLKICEELVKDKVDLSSWKNKIESEALEIGSGGDNYVSDDDSNEDEPKPKKEDKKCATSDTTPYQGERYQNNVLTLGFIGHPNVGKSSFLNAVCGKKVVSVSVTPGHTKHYQTIMLTPTVRLCDCPGLVFPSLVPKAVQVLMGCYPIPQLREPFSAVEFLAQRVPLVSVLNLTHPNADPRRPKDEQEWCAFDICEALALKRGFLTKRTGRPDVHRAANNILRIALDGRQVCLAFLPSNYTRDEVIWKKHHELPEIVAIQAHRQKEQTGRQRHYEGFTDELDEQFADDVEEISDISNASNSEAEDSDESSGDVADNKFASLADDVNC